MASSPPDKRPPKADSDSSLQSWYRMTSVGIEFIVAVLLFGGIGWYIDGRMETSPWCMLCGFIVGFVVGLYMLTRQAGRMFHD